MVLAGVLFRGGLSLPAAKQLHPCRFRHDAAVAFVFLRESSPELFKQELSHFVVDQILLDYKTVMMSIGDLDDFGMRKPALKFGN